MSTLDVLRAGRARIERGWTQGTYARAANGYQCSASNPLAIAWCIVGAINDATNETYWDARRLLGIASNTHSHRLTDWNDAQGRTQSGALAVYDRAIGLAQEAT